MIRFVIAILMLTGIFYSVQAQPSYSYDELGRITADQTKGIKKIIWNNRNRVVELIHVDTSHQADLQFNYDAHGNRILKLSKPRNGNGLLPENTWLYVYYAYDDEGTLIATYERKFEQRNAQGFEETIASVRQAVVGDKQLGYANQECILRNNSFSATVTSGRFQNVEQQGALIAEASNGPVEAYRGNKLYELNNYQQTITTVVTDRKLQTNVSNMPAFSPEVTFASDYYPYGMTMPERDYYSHPYGFNGMERLNSTSDYIATFRVYDARIAQWTSLDPKAGRYAAWSPYVAMVDNPIRYSDPLGDEPLELSFMQRVRSITKKWPKAYGMFRIILDLNSKFSTVDDNGDWKPKVPMHSTPRIPEDVEKSQKKRNKAVASKKGQAPAIGGPEPAGSIDGDLTPESGVRKKTNVDVADEVAQLGNGSRVAKKLLKFIPIVDIGVEIAAAPEGQHPLETGARILIGETPAIGDLLLMGADYLAEDYEPSVPPTIMIVQLNPTIPVGLTPEQYYNIQKSLQLETAIPEEVTWHFPTQPSLNPKLQHAVDELIKKSQQANQ